MSVHTFERLRQHLCHPIECVRYGRDEPENISLECRRCEAVLVDADRHHPYQKSEAVNPQFEKLGSHVSHDIALVANGNPNNEWDKPATLSLRCVDCEAALFSFDRDGRTAELSGHAAYTA